MSAESQYEGKLDQDTRSEVYAWYRAFAEEEGYDYRAVKTRRCLNLLELVIKMNPNSASVFSNVLTENGLLMKAEIIAASYHNRHEFPSVALADDMLVHGRGLNLFLQTFFNLIYFYLEKLGDYDKNAVEMDFYKSITIWIFAVNDTAVLLRQEYQWRMHYAHVWPESRWREFSYAVAHDISVAQLANTSYVLSAQCLNAEAPKEVNTEWESVFSGKDGDSLESFEFFVHRPSVQYGVYPTVRIYKYNQTRMFIPYFFMGQMDHDVCKNVLQVISEEADDSTPVKELLHLVEGMGENPHLASVYGQFIYLLCSQITLKQFLKEKYALTEGIVYDTEKLSRNFGLMTDSGQSVRGYLDALCAKEWSANIFEKLYRSLGLRERQGTFITADQDLFEALRSAMEMNIYRQAVRHERSAKEAEKIYISGGQIPAEELSGTGEASISELVNQVIAETRCRGQKEEIVVSILPILTQMMDSGDVSLKIRQERKEDGRAVIYSAVRNTELSLFIMPRRLKAHYSQVFRIAQFFWSEDDFSDIMERHLKEMLDVSEPREQAYLQEAVAFAKLLQSNKIALDCMLNWRNCLQMAE